MYNIYKPETGFFKLTFSMLNENINKFNVSIWTDHERNVPANSVDPDQIIQNVASIQDLLCLTSSSFWIHQQDV